LAPPPTALARRTTSLPEGDARWEIKTNPFLKLVDIPPELSAGESNITNAGADGDEGGIVKEPD
jgi:hypothetical protein